MLLEMRLKRMSSTAWRCMLGSCFWTGASQIAPCRHVASLLQKSQSSKDHIVFLVDASAPMHEAANIADPEVLKVAHLPCISIYRVFWLFLDRMMQG